VETSHFVANAIFNTDWELNEIIKEKKRKKKEKKIICFNVKRSYY